MKIPRVYLVLLVLFIFGSCSTSDASTNSSNPEVRIIETGTLERSNPGAEVIRTAEELKQILIEMEGRSKSDQELLNSIDFSKQVVGIAYLGRRLTGGFGLEIDQIVSQSESLQIFLKEIKPGPDVMVTTAITYPAILFIIDNPAPGIQILIR